MSLSEAKDRFRDARGRADREDWLARLRRQQDDLLPYEAVTQALQTHKDGSRCELRAIALDRIVGSVGRYHDFTRNFMPRSSVNPERWSRIDQAFETMEGLPPVEVYQIDDVYFVADGHHRISVACANGFKEIDAYVTNIPFDVEVDLEPGDSLDAVIIKAERAHFLTESGLERVPGAQDITCSRPGAYARLLDHVAVHRYFMKIDHPDEGEPDFAAAAADWYENVYRPIIAAIQARDLLSRFPGMSDADLYVWVSARILELREAYGEEVSPQEAAESVAGERRNRTPVYHTLLSLVHRLADKAIDFITLDSEDGLLLPGLLPEAPLGTAPETVVPLLQGSLAP